MSIDKLKFPINNQSDFITLFKASQVNESLNIDTIEPLSYQGVIVASEFETYDAKKLYLALKVVFPGRDVTFVSKPSVVLYDKNNAVNLRFAEGGIAYNGLTTVLNYTCNQILNYNILFSRLVADNYIHMVFEGYKITLK